LDIADARLDVSWYAASNHEFPDCGFKQLSSSDVLPGLQNLFAKNELEQVVIGMMIQAMQRLKIQVDDGCVTLWCRVPHGSAVIPRFAS